VLKKYPTLIIFILLVFAFESVYYLMTDPLTGHPWKDPTVDDGMVAAKYAMAGKDNHYDIAFVGDSSCLRGVVPEDFHRSTGLDVVNLCTHKMHSIAGYSLIATRVANLHPELKAVVMVTTPETMALRETQIIEYGALDKHLIAYGNEGLDFAPTFLGFRQWFVSRHAMNDFPDKFEGSYARLVEVLNERNGFLPEIPANGNINRQYPKEFKLASWQLTWLSSLNEKLRVNGVKILLALSPIPVSESNSSFLQSTEMTINELSDSFSNIESIRSRPPEYPAAAFGSPGHMLPEWASKNTLDLIPRVMTALE